MEEDGVRIESVQNYRVIKTHLGDGDLVLIDINSEVG